MLVEITACFCRAECADQVNNLLEPSFRPPAPDKPVSVRVLLPLATQDNSSAAASRLIVVREGDNVTLFCIMEGAPPPEVRTYPHNTQNSRYIMDKAFGTWG